MDFYTYQTSKVKQNETIKICMSCAYKHFDEIVSIKNGNNSKNGAIKLL